MPSARNPRSKRPTILATLLVCFLSTAVHAQPLIEKVPQDAIIYVGWLGYDAKSPGFDKSHFKAVLDAGQARQLIDQTLPALLDKLAAKDRDAAAGIDMVKPILMPMLQYPAAIFISQPDLQQNQEPKLKLGLLCQAGKDAAAMEGKIRDLLQNAPAEAQQQLKVANDGGLVSVLMNVELPADVGSSLKASEGYKSVQPHTVKDASLMAYVDIEQLVALVERGVDAFVQGSEKEMWPKVRDAIGLKSLKRFVWSSGFDQQDWCDHVFISAPEPRTGLVALADPTPLSDAALKSIPASATMAGAAQYDLSRLIAGLREAVASVEPGAEGEIDKAFDEASKRIGMDVQRDVLGTLGNEWVYYVDPMTGGRGLGGIVLLNKLKDPAKAEQALTKLEAMVTDAISNEIHEKDISLKVLTTNASGVNIHYLGTPLVSPAWAVKDGYLLVGLFPQIVAGAADQIGAQKSILDNPSYVALRKRLNAPTAGSVGFVDLPKTAPDSYATWVAISRLSGFADLFGVPAPAMLLPPLNKLMPHLSPAGSVSWTDKDGMHLKSLSPFPGATIFASDPIGGLQSVVPMIFGSQAPKMALPPIGHADEQARMSNLRQIALAGILYSAEHKGKFPPDLGTLLVEGDLPDNTLVSPQHAAAKPTFDRQDVDARKRWANEQSDYNYVGGSLTTASPVESVLAYEKVEDEHGNVQAAFIDGHVESLPRAELEERLKK